VAGIGHNSSSHLSGKGRGKVGVHHRDGESGDEEEEGNYMILTADTLNMDDEVKVAHILFDNHLARNGTTLGDGNDGRYNHGRAADSKDNDMLCGYG
jgi:hypothetical protein